MPLFLAEAPHPSKAGKGLFPVMMISNQPK
jgi:hypothetical protein